MMHGSRGTGRDSGFVDRGFDHLDGPEAGVAPPPAAAPRRTVGQRFRKVLLGGTALVGLGLWSGVKAFDNWMGNGPRTNAHYASGFILGWAYKRKYKIAALFAISVAAIEIAHIWSHSSLRPSDPVHAGALDAMDDKRSVYADRIAAKGTPAAGAAAALPPAASAPYVDKEKDKLYTVTTKIFRDMKLEQSGLGKCLIPKGTEVMAMPHMAVFVPNKVQQIEGFKSYAEANIRLPDSVCPGGFNRYHVLPVEPPVVAERPAVAAPKASGTALRS